MPNRKFQASYLTSKTGPFLRFHRQRNLLTLVDASRVLNMVPKHIQDIEKEYFVTTQGFTVANICGAFNQTVEDFESFDIETKVQMFPKYVWEMIEKKHVVDGSIAVSFARMSDVSVRIIRDLKKPEKNRMPTPYTLKKPKRNRMPTPYTLKKICKSLNISPYEMTDYSTKRFHQDHPEIKTPRFYL